ncbi:Patatin [Leptothrix cholodnii SP-6]|uniref:Patatin n=1 Tax=Leptothrix cholodnii (strain ATCC 51168 / LMG 8142 / SP-6) TaxID=395495 RepID=B1XX20_LEPCP|nr:Patatin [Leptothrix cholodnii SP-6]
MNGPCLLPNPCATRPVLHRLAAVLLVLGLCGPARAEPAPTEPAPTAPSPRLKTCGTAQQPRPCVGLVLSGGGARGLAHVGVLKVLERERIPVDLIAGTSMGAIIGGLFASGMGAAELERELLALDWEALFASRVPRETLSQRRKEEDFEISPAVEIGLARDGSPMLPLGSVSSRGLELLLRRYTLPVRTAPHFDALPIPFRAVATDMESGAPVVFERGDLAQALRASMSVPAVFPPTDVDARVLGDGGLVDNLPVDVVRALGAQVVIAVNIGTPLAARDTLGTVLGLTAQMINILTEQNVQRSIAGLDAERDLLIAPELGKITAADFGRVRELITLGESGAQALQPRLQALALPAPEWAAHQAARRREWPQTAPITSVRFEGADITSPQRLAGALASQPGQPFDIDRAEADTRALAASGDYLHADYGLEDLPAGTGLVFRLEEKPWGPHYFRLGLDVASDFVGRGEFNLKLSHNRHWLNEAGGEWRNRLQIGSVPRWHTEWYQPAGLLLADGGDTFVSVHSDVERRRINVYAPLAPSADAAGAPLLGRFARAHWRAGIDLGRPLGSWGEWRLGVVRQAQHFSPEIVAGGSSVSALESSRAQEWALRGALLLDQLDHVSFPRRGWRVRLVGEVGRRWVAESVLAGGTESFHRLEADANTVTSAGPHTLDASLRLRHAHQGLIQGLGYYTLGGFHNLSGYQAEQLSGNEVLLGRLTYTVRLNQRPVLTRGFFAGASLEAGNAWARSSEVDLGRLRGGGSVFLGADTGLGPLYFGLTWAPRGSAGLYLQLGRP